MTAAGVVLGLGTAGTAQAENFNVPPGRLGDVAVALGAQADITITVTEPDLATQPSPGVRGNLPLRAALARALRGTGAEARFYDRATIRIVRKRVALKPPKQPRPAPARATAAIAEKGPADIVITASKQNILVDRYPGSVKLIELGADWISGNAANGTAAITKQLPSIGSTNLGPGRDKLFIRGIADSSFSGPTQATTGQYLGDVRLNYNAPDPNLNLYDMQRIEVLAGPQGTLYGAGSLGGVIRIVPNAPDTRETFATVSANTAFTQHGGISRDGAGMLNLPLAGGRFAVRLVHFGGRAAGYIDSPARGLRDISGTTSYGQRLALRAEDLSGWALDFGVLFQNITSDDGQYTLRGDPPLTRNTLVPQPFENNYRLTYLTARRALGSAELVTTTSVTRHELRTVYDASGYEGITPALFEEDNAITLVSHETRVSGGSTNKPWVAGATVLYNGASLSRSLGAPEALERITGVVNIQAEAAIFGQVSRPLTRTLTGMIGGRLTFAHSTGFLIDDPAETARQSSRKALRFSGTLALDWHPGGSFSGYFRYQQGYRAGGLAVAPSESGLQSQRFAADDLIMGEVGIRLGDKARDRLSLSAAFFLADWRNIQADLIDGSGLPYTANVGHGFVYGLDGEIAWRLSPELLLTVSAFVNDSQLTEPAPGFDVSEGQGNASIADTLPNIARDGARAAASWRREVRPGIVLNTEASVRYVGLSQLGLGPLLDIPQGNYLVADAGVRLDFSRFGLSLSVDNLADARGNTFAFGNPFGLVQRAQMTPLRPRTVRLGLNVRF